MYCIHARRSRSLGRCALPIKISCFFSTFSEIHTQILIKKPSLNKQIQVRGPMCVNPIQTRGTPLYRRRPISHAAAFVTRYLIDLWYLYGLNHDTSCRLTLNFSVPPYISIYRNHGTRAVIRKSCCALFLRLFCRGKPLQEYSPTNIMLC